MGKQPTMLEISRGIGRGQWENDSPSKETRRATIAMQDKVDPEPKLIRRDKDGYYM